MQLGSNRSHFIQSLTSFVIFDESSVIFCSFPLKKLLILELKMSDCGGSGAFGSIHLRFETFNLNYVI